MKVQIKGHYFVLIVGGVGEDYMFGGKAYFDADEASADLEEILSHRSPPVDTMFLCLDLRNHQIMWQKVVVAGSVN